MVDQLAQGSAERFGKAFDRSEDSGLQKAGKAISGAFGSIFGGKKPKPITLEVKDEKQLEGDLAARFPEHAAAVHSYFRLAESVQLRFALWVVSSVLPMGARLALLASPLMRMWRKWASKTTRDGLNELIPGDDARTAQLRALMSGLWLDPGPPPPAARRSTRCPGRRPRRRRPPTRRPPASAGPGRRRSRGVCFSATSPSRSAVVVVVAAVVVAAAAAVVVVSARLPQARRPPARPWCCSARA